MYLSKRAYIPIRLQIKPLLGYFQALQLNNLLYLGTSSFSLFYKSQFEASKQNLRTSEFSLFDSINL